MNSSFSNVTDQSSGGYPRLMINKDRDAIVMFTSEETGMVVSCLPEYDQALGHYAENWNMGRFDPFIGEVILRG